jgi:hypothetical protein
MSNEFWEKWINSDEVGKHHLVQQLISGNGEINCPFFSPTLINSYFEDLYFYMKEKKTKIFIKNNEVKKEND